MGRLKKIEDELEARVCLAAVVAAGGDVGAWSRAHGFDGRSLNAWRSNLARRGSRIRGRRHTSGGNRAATGTDRSGLVELVPRSSAPTRPAFVVRVGEATVEFTDEFHPETFRRVMAVLRSC